MKKNWLKTALSLMLLCPLAVSFSSCSEENSNHLEINGDFVKEGIEAEIDGKTDVLQITSNGNWKIEIPEDASHWVYIPETSGQGNCVVAISIDSNFGSAEGRSTIITITSGDIVHKIPVVQLPTYNGEPVANADVDYTKIASTKGVGLGLNLNTLKTTTQSVINFKAINQLQNRDDFWYELFTYNIESEATATGAVIDSMESKKDSLGVAFSFDINYGDFKLNIGGAYHGDETKVHHKSEYKYGAKYNVASAYTDMASILALYDDAINGNSFDDKHTPLMKALLSPGFVKVKNQVNNSYEDSAKFNTAMESLMKNFGPVVISGCDLGGSMSLWMKFDLDSLSDVMGVDTAHLRTSIKTDLLQINAGVNVDYKKEALRVLENSSFKYQISGGASGAQNAVSNVLSRPREEGDSETVYADLHDNITAWIASLDAKDASTLTYTRLQVYPIWLFFEGAVADAVKEWIQNIYNNDQLGIIDNAIIETM